MKRKFLTIGLPILGGLAIAGVGIASAAGMMGGGGVGGPGAMMRFGGGFSGNIAATTPTQWAADQTAQFQAEASALGLSESVIVSGWAQGQSLQQIATANGISATQLQADMKNYAQSQEKAGLDALVAQGTITSAQETSYLAAEATAHANFQASGGPGKFRGKRPTSTPSTSSN